MGVELTDTTPSEGLKRQCRPDEEIEWVVEKDMKTVVISAITSSISLIVMTVVFGLFAGLGVLEVTGSALFGGVAFVLVTFGPPLGKIAVAVLNATWGGVEYAATTDRFVQYKETLGSTDVDTVPIERVRDAEYDQEFTDKLFGTGDIRIEGARGDSLYFNNAPNADTVLRAVREEIANADTVDVENPQAAANSD